MNYLKKYLKYKQKYLDLKLQQGGDNNLVNEEYGTTDPKYLDLKLQQGGDNNCGVKPSYGSKELFKIVRRWYKKQEVSWSSGQNGYYLMHMVRTGRNLGVNCTDFNNHIHLISADLNGTSIDIIFSQKIYGHPVRIYEDLIDKLIHLIKTDNYTEIDNYLIKEQFTLSSIMTRGSDRNKTYELKNYDDIWLCLYIHSLIGDRIRQLLDSGQLRIYEQYCGVNPDYGSRELLEIVRRWYEKREVSWSSGEEGYYLMHMAKTWFNSGVNCTDFNNHIHLISADLNGTSIDIIFSQKIYGHPVRIYEDLIDKLIHLIKTDNYTEIDNYLIKEQFTLSSIMTRGSDRNKTYELKNYDDIWLCLYIHSLIGDRIRQLLDSGQLRIYVQYCGVNPDHGSIELLKIVRRWYEQREVSWSLGEKGYYLMHMAKTGFYLGVNCTDFNNHIHLISADLNGTSIDIIFSQKIYGYPVRISDELISLFNRFNRSENYTEFDNYLIKEQFSLSSITTHGSDRNKTYKLENYDNIWLCLYTHSFIGYRIKQLLDSGQLIIHEKIGTN